jgi:hypothetical protein
MVRRPTERFDEEAFVELQAAIGQPRVLKCMDLQLSCMDTFSLATKT